ncbi:MAG TPA: hypothetical protein VIE39_03635, partial [Thermoanaerobaculia bacterium]
RVLRRVPEHRYDLYVLSDHGQAPCQAYRALSGGRRFERWIFDHFLNDRTDAPPEPASRGLAHGIRSRRQGAAGLFQHYLNYIDEDFMRESDPEAYQRNGVRVIAAGPNAFLYVLDAAEPLDAEALEGLFPELAEKLSRSPGVGFVLARSERGPVCFWRGRRHSLGESGPGPFGGRPDAFLAIRGIRDLMDMPSAGDYVIYGIDAPQGHVSFIPEAGAHAGPSQDEMNTFIIRPGHVSLPDRIEHPIQLYDHFIRYQEPS